MSSTHTTAPKAFLIGIGGMGMVPLALYLKEMGWQVCGHDDKLAAPSRQWLNKAEIPCEGFSTIPEDCTLAVYSSAISKEHPFYKAAAARALPLLRRGECLSEVLGNRRLLAIVGSHGKTTTTAMLVHLLRRSGVAFSYLIGGLYSNAAYPPAHFEPDADWVVCEIDESDGTIERFSPAVSLALNFDWDHPDRYCDEGALEQMFAGLFARSTHAVIVPQSSERLVRLAKNARCQNATFSVAEDFNESNAHAALEAARFITAQTLSADDLKTFPGIRRRQDVLLARPRLRVLADYAHHPTEIAALLTSLKKRYAASDVWVVFQPHRYTRTRQYAANFAKALCAGDRVFLLPVYPASEPFLADGTHAQILQHWPEGKTIAAEVAPAALSDVLFAELSASVRDTTVVFVGAGDIDQMAAAWVARLDADFYGDMQGRLSPESALRQYEPLAQKTTFRIGGPARYYAEPASREDLSVLLQGAQRHAVRVFILGRGSNVLVPDEGFDGLVIRLNAPAFSQVTLLDDGRMRAGAGVRLKALCAQAATEGFTGFEAFEGIPACVGGALRMNAGAMGSAFFDRVESVVLMDYAGKVYTLPAQALHPQYRICPEVAQAIALEAVFAPLGRDDPAQIHARMSKLAQQRKASQPREASAGCVFQNPLGDSAGRLIDFSGLKSCTQGGAQVSGIHANFIVNTANTASCADVLALIRQVRERVQATSGKLLQPEIRLMGKAWKDVL